MQGYVHSIESMGLVDGPGVRTVVFLSGCLLRCKYCHNPDTWNIQNFDKEYSPRELTQKVLRYKEYFGSNGGVTFSGGEPLLQLDFVIETFKLLKEHGIHTCLDTAGVLDYSNPENYRKLSNLFKVTDLVLLDVKHFAPEKYKDLTGRDIEHFNKFLTELQKTDIPIWIRHVVVPNLTCGKEHILGLKRYVSSLKNVEKVELLPYHTMGIKKYKKLNLDYQLKNTLPPSNEEMEAYNEIINE